MKIPRLPGEINVNRSQITSEKFWLPGRRINSVYQYQRQLKDFNVWNEVSLFYWLLQCWRHLGKDEFKYNKVLLLTYLILTHSFYKAVVTVSEWTQSTSTPSAHSSSDSQTDSCSHGFKHLISQQEKLLPQGPTRNHQLVLVITTLILTGSTLFNYYSQSSSAG